MELLELDGVGLGGELLQRAAALGGVGAAVLARDLLDDARLEG